MTNAGKKKLKKATDFLLDLFTCLRLLNNPNQNIDAEIVMFRFNEPTFEPSALFKEILLWLVQNKAEFFGAWDPNNDEYMIGFYPSGSDEPSGQVVQEPTRITVWVRGRYNNQSVEVTSLEQFINLIEPLWEKYNPNEGLTLSD